MDSENKVMEVDDYGTRALAAMEKAEVSFTTPTAEVERSVSDYAKGAMQLALDQQWFKRHMQEDLARNFDEMKTDEKITLYNIEVQAQNDLTSKLLSPLVGMMTERQRAEIQAAAQKQNQAAGGVNVQINNNQGSTKQDDLIADQTPVKTRAALNIWYQLSQALEAAQPATPTEENISDPE